MKKIRLYGTDLDVLPLSLGTAQFGAEVTKEDAFRQLDRFAETADFIDTAHVYGNWVPGTTALSEQVIGEWLSTRKNRRRIVLSTKGAHPAIDTMDVPRVTPSDITRDLDGSLTCLGTDHIDLYFLHRDDPAVPVADILECLEAQKKAGRIRFYGCSNWRLGRIREAAAYAKEHGMSGFVCNQLMWSLAEVNFNGVADKTLVLMDRSTYRYHVETSLNAMAYMGLAKGYFTRRAQRQPLKKSVADIYSTPGNDVIFSTLPHLSDKYGISVTELSLLYLMAQPFAVVPVVSFSNIAQMEEVLPVLDRAVPGKLSEELSALRKDLK